MPNIDRMTDVKGFSPPVAKLIGIEAVSFELGRAVLTLRASERHANPMGTVHGGVITDLADLAMGVAYWSTLETGESFTTLELKANFLKPVWTGILTAKASVKKGGRTTALLECEVRDEGGSLVAFFTSTCLALRGEMAKGR